MFSLQHLDLWQECIYHVDMWHRFCSEEPCSLLRVSFILFDAEFKDGSDIDMSDILKNIKSLYKYNLILREKLLTTESEVRALATKSSRENDHQM